MTPAPAQPRGTTKRPTPNTSAVRRTMPQTSSAWDEKTVPTADRTRDEGAGRRAVVRRRAGALADVRAEVLAFEREAGLDDDAAGRRVVARRRPVAAGAGDRRVLEVDRPEGRAPAGRRFVVTTMRTT